MGGGRYQTPFLLNHSIFLEPSRYCACILWGCYRNLDEPEFGLHFAIILEKSGDMRKVFLPSLRIMLFYPPPVNGPDCSLSLKRKGSRRVRKMPVGGLAFITALRRNEAFCFFPPRPADEYTNRIRKGRRHVHDHRKGKGRVGKALERPRTSTQGT